jgi:hypothetical protein
MAGDDSLPGEDDEQLEDDSTQPTEGPVPVDADELVDALAELNDVESPAAGSTQAPDASSVSADLSDRAKSLLSPTLDGGPPMARPIVIVRLRDEQVERIVNHALAAASQRDAQTCGELAEQKVKYAFWVRDCEERAIMGDF